MRRLHRSGPAWLLALSLAVPAWAAPAALWLQASVDHADSGLVVRVLRDDAGWYYLRRLDAVMLELPLQEAPELRFEDEAYLRIDALSAHRLLLDEDRERALFLSPAVASHAAAATVPAPAAALHAEPPLESPAEPPAVALPTAPAVPAALDPAPSITAAGPAQALPTQPAASGMPAPSQPPVQDPEEILLLDVTVNGQAVAGVWQARQDGTELYLEAGLLQAAGIRLPVDQAPRPELPLSELSGGRYLLDRSTLQLDMTVAPELLEGRRFALAPPFQPGPPPDSLSAILGYALSASRVDGRSRGAGLLDLAIARGRATCASSHRWRHGEGFARLDSSCRLDWPERTLSLELGDSLAEGARLQPGVRFTGLRLGSDFSLNPYLRTLPDVGLQGSARLPSTLELWIDQQLALRSEIPPGPFDIRDIPTHTGSGELRAIVTDALGRQTVLGAPVFADPRLLRRGLLDWSAEAGRLRLGGPGDERLGPRFAAFSARRGMGDRLTADLRSEIWDGGVNLGLGGIAQLGARGLVELGFAASERDGHRGQAWQAGYSLRAQRLSLGLRHTRHSREFASLAWQQEGEAPSRQTHASLGLALRSSQLNLAWVDRRLWDGEMQRFASASLHFRAFGRASVSLSLSHAPGREDDTRIGLFIVLPLDGGLSLDTSLRHSDVGLASTAGVRRHAPIGPGFGWQARARHGAGERRAELDALWRTGWGELGLAVDSGDGGTALRGDLSGSLIAAAGGVYAARREPGSYAVVDTGLPGLRVYRDNQVAAIADARGRALVPGLRPFERNTLRLAVQDLPLSARLAQDRLDLVPGRRQAVSAAFGLQQVRYLSARLLREDGSAPPPGALLRVEGMDEPGVVGYEGEFFVEIPTQALVALDAEWNGSRCRATVLLDAQTDALVETGPLRCIETGEP